MFLKWTARALAVAAVTQFGTMAMAQDGLGGVGRAAGGVVRGAGNVVGGAARGVGQAGQQTFDAGRGVVGGAAGTVRQGVGGVVSPNGQPVNPNGPYGQPQGNFGQNPQPGMPYQANRPVQAGFDPNAQAAQPGDHVRQATQHLNLDDETRSRYRFMNGEWWFQTKSGNWKVHRNGQWRNADPGQPGVPSSQPPAGQSGFDRNGEFRASDADGQSYFYAGPTNTYGGNRGYDNPGYRNSGYNSGYRNDGYGPGYRNDGYGQRSSGYGPRYNDGYGYNIGYNNNGYGSNNGYYGNPGYGMTPRQAAGASVGSQIGGRVGGNTGAIIGGAIGANAAEGR